MKTLFSAVAIFGLSLFISCNKTSDSNSSDIVLTGTWKVSLFIESAAAQTSDFDGYTFTFGNNAVLTATKNGASTTGTWTQAPSVFTIGLGAKSDSNKPLGQLTGDWEIIAISSSEIRLTNNSTSSEELVTFTKN